MELSWIEGGVTAPQGFLAQGVACGLKKNKAMDLALLVSGHPAAWAGVFTTNQVKGHSLRWTQSKMGGRVRAVLINSGNANACLGAQGEANAGYLAAETAKVLSLSAEEILLASTGVIGMALNLQAISGGLRDAAAGLDRKGGGSAARAIMTTDTFPKEAAVEITLDGRRIRIGGMAKGSGMIHPDLATLLGFLTTDAPVAADALELALRQAVSRSFNSITVDGDTSPCDAIHLLANGQAGGDEIQLGTIEYDIFAAGLTALAERLACLVVEDGEGATKFVTFRITGARSEEEARVVGRTIARSNLVKTAIFGADANWGRILTAAGYAGVPMDPAKVSICLGEIPVCQNGGAVPFDEERAAAILAARQIEFTIDLGLGGAGARVWTCDLSYDYVKINGSYRS